jgi:hypothetical protein
MVKPGDDPDETREDQMIRPGREELALASNRSNRLSWLGGIAVAGLSTIALLAAGCGGGSSSSSSSSSASTAATVTGPLTKAEFVAKANAICVKGTARTEKAGQSLGNSPTEHEAAVAVPAKFVPAVQTQLDELKALSVAPGEEATVTSMLNLGQADLDRVKSEPKLAFETKTFADFARVAHAYGLKSCAPRS